MDCHEFARLRLANSRNDTNSSDLLALAEQKATIYL